MRKNCGYGEETENSPDIKQLQIGLATRRKKSWAITNRIQMLSKITFNFFRLVLLKLKGGSKRIVPNGQSLEKISDNYNLVERNGKYYFAKKEDETRIDVNRIEEDVLDKIYPHLLLNMNLTENDESEDYRDDLGVTLRGENTKKIMVKKKKKKKTMIIMIMMVMIKITTTTKMRDRQDRIRFVKEKK